MTTITMRCHCNGEYEARPADLKRGWGLSCSKHCAAIRRKYHKPKGKPVDSTEAIKPTQPKPSTKRPNDNRYQFTKFSRIDHPCNDDDFDPSWDAHKDYQQ